MQIWLNRRISDEKGKLVAFKSVTLDVEASDTIAQVKAKIQEAKDIPAALVHLWRPEAGWLAGGRTLSDYGIQHEDIVVLVVHADRPVSEEQAPVTPGSSSESSPRDGGWSPREHQ
jgi:hypothetical protein